MNRNDAISTKERKGILFIYFEKKDFKTTILFFQHFMNVVMKAMANPEFCLRNEV